jgi:hypothetical protein
MANSNIHVYHPSKSGKGFASSFSYSEKDNNVYATLLKQSGWNDETQTGTFKASVEDPNGRVNIKLGQIEISAILDCIDRNRPFSTFHDSDLTPKQIGFTPWMDKADPSKPIVKGYSFSITVSNKQDTSFKNSFYIGFNFAEARLIREFLINCLSKQFNSSNN